MKPEARRLGAKVDAVNTLGYASFKAHHVPSTLLTYTPANQSHNTKFSITFKDTNPLERRSKRAKGSKHSYDTNEVSESELEACFNLIESTSRTDYENSSSGWRPAAKRAEMREEYMRYLLIRSVHLDEASANENEARSSEPLGRPSSTTEEAGNDANGEGDRALGNGEERNVEADDSVLGFVSFMVTMEEGAPVVYLYEIHLAAAVRGLGLGRHLFGIVEHIASSCGMEKVMLTVYRSNGAAREMYKKLGYVVDDCSPRARMLRGGVRKEADYLILSKRVPQTSTTGEMGQHKRKRQEAE